MTANRKVSTSQTGQEPESRPDACKALAIEIDHLAEDLLDAADAIERLTRKYSEDVQNILKIQAEQIKALAADQGLGGKDGTVNIDD